MSIFVDKEDPNSDVAVTLIKELSQELARLYGDDGSASFTPNDVTVPRSAFVVAWEDGKALACGALRPTKDENTAEIKRMYVRKAARGKGVSRKILARLEALAHEYQFKRVILETGIYQIAAIGLYESSDYQKMACYGEYVDSPHSLCYEKSVEQLSDYSSRD